MRSSKEHWKNKLDGVCIDDVERRRRRAPIYLQITGLHHVREIGLSSWGIGHIPRRYCSVVADLNIGKPRTVYYSIIENGGFVGRDYGVEWCVSGLDYHRAYAPDCKMARP